MDSTDVSKGTNTCLEETTQSMLGELHDRLDSLWKSYLDSLDAYTAAQKTLQAHMSAGFLSLARANFNARTGVRRYGQDYYHDRAVATRRADISMDDESSKATIKVVQHHPLAADPEQDIEISVKVEKTGEIDEDVTQLPSPLGTPELQTEAERPDSSSDADSTTKPTQKVPLESDPLKWFGILVPAALRSSQASFFAAIDEAVADAANAARSMRSNELELRKLRKEIKRVEKDVSKPA